MNKVEARLKSLEIMQEAGVVYELRTNPTMKLVVNGQPICHYKAHVEYTDRATRKIIVEEVTNGSGRVSSDKSIKRKLAQALYPDIEFRIFK